MTLKRFMAMNIFNFSAVWFFSTRFQLYQFLIALLVILDNFSWCFSPKPHRVHFEDVSPGFVADIADLLPRQTGNPRAVDCPSSEFLGQGAA
jgi:hypothetical protein